MMVDDALAALIMPPMQFLGRPGPPPGYDVHKAAQVAAYFLIKAGGSSEVLKLAKLLYLAERASYERFGEPLIGDQPYSMEHGPVLTLTLDYIRNTVEPPQPWQDLITERVDNDVGLQDPDRRIADLRRLSDADIEMLNAIWLRVGHMTSLQLRRWTHDNCPEYDESVGKSSRPIRMEVLLEVLSFTAAQAEQVEIEACERVRYLAALKRAEA
jgi:uncharacterized phage-associated protein